MNISQNLTKHIIRAALSSRFSTQKGSLSIETVLKSYSQQFADSQTMEAMIPRTYTQRNLQSISSNLRFSQSDNHLDGLTKTFSEPIWDLLDRGGKRWRPVLCMLIAQLYGRKKEEIYDIAALCQIVHNGTLLVDDIEDNSTIRRNKPCVHLLYGTDIAVNSGNFMYYAPMLSIMKSGKYNPVQLAQLNEIYLEEMVQLHIGQGWDILWHNIDKLEGKYPTENQYLQMTAHKTGVLARLSARMVCTVLDVSEKDTKSLSRFVQNLGVAFQIQDDLLNLQGQQFKNTKGYNGEDIHEGKITLMVIHHLQNANRENKDRLITLLKKKTDKPEEISQAIGLLRESGSLEKARIKMHSLIDSCCRELDNDLPVNPARELLKELAEFGIKRQK